MSPFASPQRQSIPSTAGMASLRPLWESLCTELKYSNTICTGGWELLERLHSTQDRLSDGGSQSSVPLQLAAAAYLTSSMGKDLPGVSVTELARHSALNLKELFSVVIELHSRLYPGQELTEVVPAQKSFIVATIAFAKWKEFSRTLFPTGFAGATATDGEATVSLSVELGWLLYALGKCHMTTGATDPLSAYHLLASVIHLLLAHIPEEAMTSGVFWTKLESPVSVSAPCYPFPDSTLSILWSHLKAVPAEVAKQQPTVTALVTDLAEIFSLGDVTAAGALTPMGGAKLRRLLAPSALSSTVEAVRSRYDAIWASKSPLDDTFFLLPPQAPRQSSTSIPASPCRPSQHAGSTAASPRNRSSSSAGLLTPLRGSNPMGRHAAPPSTPMTSQLESVSWLSEAVPRSSSTSDLARYFNACSRSPQNDIEARLSRLCDRVRSVSSIANEQLELGQGLYYKMLLSFLKAEEQRLRQTDFSTLLANDAFHTSLLACCLESVFASYSTPGMLFPAILNYLELQPFDFGKVIESFVRHEPNLPTHLKVHFADVESKIIETLAWRDDSPLHVLMSEYDAAVSADESGATPQPGASRAKAALEQFVKKCLYLAAKRIQDMCLRLLLPSALTQQVWEVAKLVIDSARQLLKGRHLDQILMCSVYGVCKVNQNMSQRNVTFRHIIEQYKRQPNASQKIFREVRMHCESEEAQDIIAFYNHIFIPAMKEHLLRVCAAAPTHAAAPANAPLGGVTSSAMPTAIGGASSAGHGSPDIASALATRGTASPRHVSASGAPDVYVSSRSTVSHHLTPRTRTLYAFSDTPAGGTGSLRDINTNINSALPGATSDVAANALHMMSSGTTPITGSVPSGGEVGANGDAATTSEVRRPFSFGSGGGVMASGHKRNRALMDPPPTGRSSSTGSSDEPTNGSEER